MTTSTKITLKVEPRTLIGRKVKSLRRQNLVPANIFGSKTKSLSVQVPLDVFSKVSKAAGETNLVYLTVEGEDKPRPVLISAVQLHPVTDVALHVDFHQVDLTQKVTANIPLEFIGTSPAIADLGGVLVQLANEIEVEALPTDLPDKFEIDLGALKELGDSISVKDVKVDTTKIEIKTDPELQLVQAQEPQPEEEVVVETPQAEVETATPEASTESAEKSEPTSTK